MASALVICGVVLLLVSFVRSNTDTDDGKLADVINNFGIGYYKLQVSKNQNSLVSGYGAATTRTMMLSGARTDTERELRNTLGYNDAGLSRKQIEDSFNRILIKQQNHNIAYGLGVGNSLWTQSGFNVLPDFKNDLANNFLAYENNVDFGSSSSTNAIQSWVANVTQSANNNLFGGFNANAEVIAFINVVSFSGRMKIPFLNNGFTNQSFTSNDGNSRNILMMKAENMFNYSFSLDLDAEILEIPYNGNEVSMYMYILLPRLVGGLTNLEQKLTLKNLKASIAVLYTLKVALTMPFVTAFTQVSTFSYLLLQKADQVDADLSGIDGQTDLYQALAGQNYRYRYATQNTDSSISGQTQVTFNANRPFLYFFLHKPTGIILFMGRMARS